MTNEIKELIDNIKIINAENRKNDFNHIILQSNSMEQLLDYITNLQKENEKLKNLYTNEKSHKIDCDYFKTLYSKADKDIIIEDLVYKCEQCRVLYDSAEKHSFENYDLQQRIDKAIQLIEKQKRKMYKSRNKIAMYILMKIENILKGETIEEIPLFEGTMEQLDNLTILKEEGK